jgi:hypothetical protein
MPTARYALVAGAINDVIYAAGGADRSDTPLSTLEAYDPTTNTWSTRAPMPTPRWLAAGGVVDGLLYVVGGYLADGSTTSAVEAYDPATNTWSTKAPLPAPLAGATAAVSDGVLYVICGRPVRQSVVYAYDPGTDAWSVKTPMKTPLTDVAAASLNGTVYAIGGSGTGVSDETTVYGVVQTFVDGLRWSSSAPSVARVDQTGRATPLSAGKAIIVANVGGTTCGSSCPVFSVVGPTDMSIDVPSNNAVITAGATFKIDGWAINRAAATGTGVDAIHVYIAPAGGVPTFVGVATYGNARSDIGALYGSQFTNSGF